MLKARSTKAAGFWKGSTIINPWSEVVTEELSIIFIFSECFGEQLF